MVVPSFEGIVSMFTNVITLVYNTLKDFFNNFFQFFEFDNPKKTLMLSLLMLLGVVGIISFFSGTSILSSGVTGVTGDSKYTINALGDKSLSAGGTTPDIPGITPTTQPPQGGITNCRTDQDCQGTGEDANDRLCCLPELYSGYYCEGHCLRSTGFERDACKLPASCITDKTDLITYVKNELTQSCMYKNQRDRFGNLLGENDRDAWCKENVGSTGGYNANGGCCQENTEVGYGMCLLDKPGASCNNWEDVLDEKQVQIIAVKAYEI
jgi:hypothetical protein